MFLGWLWSIFRPIISVTLGLVVFFGLLAFLLVDNVRDNFLVSEFYTENLAANEVYTRFYDEVLLDEEYKDTTEDLLGDVGVDQKDIADVAREIIPPDYLQEQVEGAIRGTIDYLNKDTRTPEVYISLGPPLERVKPALFRYIDGRIDDLEDVPVTTLEELQTELESLYRTLSNGDLPTHLPAIDDPQALVTRSVDQQLDIVEEVPVTTLEEFTEELENVYRQLANAQLPTRVPSIGFVPVAVRIAAYDLAFQAIRNDPSIPKEAIKGLKEREDEIKDQLREGTITGAVRVASPALTGPVVGEFVDRTYDEAYRALKEDVGFPERALEGLDGQREAIKESLQAGDVKESLKLGARGLTGPLIDDAIEEIRKELDDQDRLDLVAKAAEQNDKTKEEFLDRVDPLRTVIDRGEVGAWLTILLMVLGLLFMAVVQFPRLASALRWPGMTLIVSGVIFLVIGLVARSNPFGDPLERASADPIPPTLVDIINDVFSSMTSDIAGGFISVPITVIVIGLVMIIGSLFVRALRIPFFSR